MNLRIAAVCAALAVCFPIQAAAEAQGLPSSTRLLEGADDSDWTYRNPALPVTKYKKFIIDQTVISADPAATWGKIDPAKRQEYAQILTRVLRDEIGSAYQIVDRPGPDVGRMRLTLLGVKATKAVGAMATRATPLGMAFTSVKSLAGKKGSFMGSVHAAFELSDSRSGEIVFGAVRRRSPNALDMAAAVSTEKTVEAVGKDIANAVRKGLDEANGR